MADIPDDFGREMQFVVPLPAKIITPSSNKSASVRKIGFRRTGSNIIHKSTQQFQRLDKKRWKI